MKTFRVILLISIVYSCNSINLDNFNLSNSLIGIVYDDNNEPIKNAKLHFKRSDKSEDYIIYTDIDGRFFIPELPFSEYIIVVTSKETLETTIIFDHFDVENVLIIQMSTFDNQLDLLKESLQVNEYKKSAQIINKIKNHYKTDIIFIYLEAFYYYKTDDYVKSEEILLLNQHYESHFIYLLLSDIYQYKLINNVKALEFLEKCNKDKFEISKRIEELKNDI